MKTIRQIADEIGVSKQAVYKPVSYTHLDVYKRQVLPINAGTITFYDVNGNTVEYWNNPL